MVTAVAWSGHIFIVVAVLPPPADVIPQGPQQLQARLFVRSAVLVLTSAVLRSQRRTSPRRASPEEPTFCRSTFTGLKRS
eukprot:scaffold2879_cov269-Prasinococcus_capsulatus_cf.AAC.43